MSDAAKGWVLAIVIIVVGAALVSSLINDRDLRMAEVARCVQAYPMLAATNWSNHELIRTCKRLDIADAPMIAEVNDAP